MNNPIQQFVADYQISGVGFFFVNISGDFLKAAFRSS